MPFGTSNGGLGLEAKIDAVVDRSSQRQITKDVEDAISKAEGSVGGGFESRTMPGGGSGGAGGATAAGGAGLLSKIGGSGLLTVAAGGVVFTQMLQAMKAASGRLKATANILGTAFKIALKPLGDFLGELARPMAKGLLAMALEFNKTVGPALVGAAETLNSIDQAIVGTIVKGIKTIAGVFSGGASNVLQGWFGAFPGWVGGIIDDFPSWAGGIIDDFVGWSGGIIDAFPGWSGNVIDSFPNWIGNIIDLFPGWGKWLTGVDLGDKVTSVDLNTHVEPFTAAEWDGKVAKWTDTNWNNHVDPWTKQHWGSKVRRWQNWASKINSVDLQDFVDPAHRETDPRDPNPPECDPPCGPGEFCRGGVCVPARREPPPRDGDGTDPGAPPGGPRPASVITTTGTRTTTADPTGSRKIDVSLALNGIRLTEGITQELDAKSSTVSGR